MVNGLVQTGHLFLKNYELNPELTSWDFFSFFGLEFVAHLQRNTKNLTRWEVVVNASLLINN